MTEITENNMNFIMGEEKTPGQLVAFLKDGAMFRSFGHVLEELRGERNLSEVLSEGLYELTGEEYESIARKVRNWLNGRNVPQNRETLFQICFVLGLSESEASRVLGSASDTGIHYRDMDELVYAYALRTGKSYREALELKKYIRERLDLQEFAEKNPKEMSVYTAQVKDAFSQVKDDEALLCFFQNYAGMLGTLHETAYRKFAQLLDCLLQPEGNHGMEERRYTMEEVVRDYIRMNVPETRKSSDYTFLQRLIKKYWPNENSLINMRSRKEDVSRKALLLLYLVTESFDEMTKEEEAFYLAQQETEEDLEIRLETRFQKMNLFLDMYGMNRLDPGNPFDFLVLYAMKTQEGDAVSDRMKAVLEEIFA